MAGDHGVQDNANLKGLSRYFNGETNFGRGNCAKATYAVVAVTALYFYLKPKKAPAAPKA